MYANAVSEFLTQLQQGAIALHELYRSLISAGFTEREALRLIGEVMNNRSNGDTGTKQM